MIELNNAPREILDAIANGYVYDDGGNDVRITKTMSPYDHNGHQHDPATIYRLWDSLGHECFGKSFTVYEHDGSVEIHGLASSGSDLTVEGE